MNTPKPKLFRRPVSRTDLYPVTLPSSLALQAKMSAEAPAVPIAPPEGAPEVPFVASALPVSAVQVAATAALSETPAETAAAPPATAPAGQPIGPDAPDHTDGGRWTAEVSLFPRSNIWMELLDFSARPLVHPSSRCAVAVDFFLCRCCGSTAHCSMASRAQRT